MKSKFAMTSFRYFSPNEKFHGSCQFSMSKFNNLQKNDNVKIAQNKI